MSPEDAAALADSLEQAAALEGADGEALADAVYARLFAESPELEGLFLLGPSAKARMLSEVFAALADLAGEGRYGLHLVRAERVNHADVLEVPPARFMSFFTVVRDTLATRLGPTWTPAHDRAWTAALGELEV